MWTRERSIRPKYETQVRPMRNRPQTGRTLIPETDEAVADRVCGLRHLVDPLDRPCIDVCFVQSAAVLRRPAFDTIGLAVAEPVAWYGRDSAAPLLSPPVVFAGRPSHRRAAPETAS